ncbi:hypothetical protein HID58_075647 [Brassica napus]|uniref:Uncharacterized protein n=2 Tax=Brassica TaxID=3705 RepID=A0ABQ7YK76_BRANA|nr:hypothetical protein HID58_075647 [Brassica napus]
MLIIVDRYTGPQYRRPCKPLSSFREKTPVSRAFGLWETVATLASVSPAFDSGKRWLPSHRLRRLGVPVVHLPFGVTVDFLSGVLEALDRCLQLISQVEAKIRRSLIFSILAIPTDSCRWLMKFDPGDNLGLSGVLMEEG